MNDTDVTFQLVPPHIHRRYLFKRAIRAFKEHSIAGLGSIDPSFPMHEWCILLKQVEITLNMIRAFRVHPKLSVYNEMHGVFNFTKTPLAPVGIKIKVREHSNVRHCWATHGLDRWYLGPSMEYYMCY